MINFRWKKERTELEAKLAAAHNSLAAAQQEIAYLKQALANAPKAHPPDSPIEFVTTDKYGNHYYTFKSEEQITVWRAEGIFRTINNSALSISDSDIIEHEQIQNELFTKLAVAKPEEKAELQRQFFHNSARLQERLRNCGEYEFLLALSKLVMVCENEPLPYAESAKWDAIKTERLKADPQLLGFFLPKASILSEALKNYQRAGQMDLLIQLVNRALHYKANTPTADTIT